LQTIINLLISQQPLPPKYKNHILVGNWQGFHECHIEPDWLLTYQTTTEELILVETGTHADLF